MADNAKSKTSKLFGYLVAHWRGEINLFQSFWGNYGAIYAVLTVLPGLIIAGVGFRFFRGMAAFIAVSQMVNVAAFVWMGVGNWRAAGNHIRKTCRRLWPWLARLTVVTHAVVLVLVTFPSIWLMSRIAMGVGPFDAHKVVRTGSHEILVQGELGANVPGKVSEILEGAPEIEWIRLESEGGWVNVGRELANLIMDRGLKVRVWNECSSACFDALMAADVRAISPKARIGLHAPSLKAGPNFISSWVISDERRYLAGRGVPESFLDKAYATPPDSSWYPSFEELIEAGVVTHVMEDGETRPVRPE